MFINWWTLFTIWQHWWSCCILHICNHMQLHMRILVVTLDVSHAFSSSLPRRSESRTWKLRLRILYRQVSTWRTDRLKFALGVSKANAKAFEPRIGQSTLILIQTPSFRELSYHKQCVRPLLVGATACHVPFSGEVQSSWTYTYSTWMDLRLTVWPQCHRIYYISCSSGLC